MMKFKNATQTVCSNSTSDNAARAMGFRYNNGAEVELDNVNAVLLDPINIKDCAKAAVYGATSAAVTIAVTTAATVAFSVVARPLIGKAIDGVGKLTNKVRGRKDEPWGDDEGEHDNVYAADFTEVDETESKSAENGHS